MFISRNALPELFGILLGYVEINKPVYSCKRLVNVSCNILEMSVNGRLQFCKRKRALVNACFLKIL